MPKTEVEHLLHGFTPSINLKGVNNEIPSILLFMDQAIEKYEEELARIRRARAELAAGPDRRHKRKQNLPSNGNEIESIGELLMNALLAEGPLTVKQIHRWVTASGKIAQYHTVSSMVNYYHRKKYIKRVRHGTYALADASTYAIADAPHPPKPELTNGAPLPKNGIP